jgi:translocation and assembly module TamB
VRWLKWISAVIAAVIVLVIAAGGLAVWLVASEGGTAWLLARVSERTAPLFVADGVRGTLWRGVFADTVRLRVDGHEIDAQGIQIDWNPRALVRRELVIERITVVAIDYRHTPEPLAGAATDVGSAADVTFPELPFSVSVRDASVVRITIATDDEPIVLEGTAFAADAAGREVVVHRLATVAQGFRLAASGTAELEGPLAITAVVDWDGMIDGQGFAGEGTLDGTWPAFELVQQLTAPFPLALAGSVELEPERLATLDLRWTDASWPAWPDMTSPSGSATVSGAFDALVFAGQATLVIGGETVELALDGRSEGLTVELDALAVESLYGTATAAGRIELAPLTWDLAVEGRGIDPGLLVPDWAGRLDGAARIRGQLEPELQWQVSELAIDGELRGFPFAASGAIAQQGDRWEVERLRVDSGVNFVALNGVVSDQLSLRIEADVEALSALLPELSGSVVGEAQVSGPRRDPQARGRFEAAGLAWGDYAVESLVVLSDVDGGPVAALDLSVTAGHLTLGRFAVERLDVQLAGGLADHALHLSARADDWSAELAARGALEAEIWTGVFDALAIDQDQLGVWRMAAPTALSANRSGGAVVAPFCLLQDDARVCGELSVAGTAQDRLELTAEQFDLRALAPFFPEGFSADGIWQADVSVRDFTGAPRGSLTIRSAGTTLDFALPGQPPFATLIEDIAVTASLEQAALALDARFAGADTGLVNVTISVDDVQQEDPQVSARLNVSWPDLSFLALLSPDVTEVAGSLAVELEADGRASDPRVQGRATLENGSIGVPALGLLVSDIAVRAQSPDGRVLAFDATGLIGDRPLTVEGTTELDYRTSFPTTLTLRGDAVPAVRLPEAEIFVSPDLTATVQLPQIRVDGTVHVPRARITIQEVPPQAVSPSTDTIVHGVEQPEAARPIDMRSDLRLTLGEDVRYTGMNLDTRISGELRLTYQSGRPANASGVVTMDGTYNAYGQLLDLDRGELIFSGPIDNPSLDVRAVREIGDITVGVQLIGPLQSPETRIFSSPARSEADALAYLLFGRPLTGSRGEESATLQTAAIAMGLQQALPVVQRIGQAVGLDEFTVQTTETDAGALMAGKYLSPNVYIRYSYGLFNRVGGLLLRFRINERLSLETRSAEHKSMDLLYTVERD